MHSAHDTHAVKVTNHRLHDLVLFSKLTGQHLVHTGERTTFYWINLENKSSKVNKLDSFIA